jgi:hypothetical protein
MISRGITRFGIVAVAAFAIALTATGVFGSPPSASADGNVCFTSGYDFSGGDREYFSYSRPCAGADAYRYFVNEYYLYPQYNQCQFCGYGNQFYNQYPQQYFNQYPQYFNQYPQVFTGYGGYGFRGY